MTDAAIIGVRHLIPFCSIRVTPQVNLSLSDVLKSLPVIDRGATRLQGDS